MILNRHFCKVYRRKRKPLQWQPFLEALDSIVIADVAFALTGKDVKSEGKKDSVPKMGVAPD